MGLRKRQPSSQIPEVNLVPMMDVLMTVLTFFIIISMTLTGQQLLNVRLPQDVEAGEGEPDPTVQVEALVVGLDQDGNLVMDNQTVALNQVAQRMREYFAETPDGKVVLKADRELPYRTVSELLTDLRSIGGNRVSLAVE
ncbi:biopolymer transporter ExbD [filamentous cyanobacterium CCP5]|nr:biopolymer transporter ExbD [filamentous cyanobacterium CCP5]